MIIVLRPGATDTEINYIMDRLRNAGLSPYLSKGVERTIICVIGDERTVMNYPFEAISGIERVIPILKPYKLASFEFKQEYSVVEVNGFL
jgi:3-deoxy-7-phosphoheptulonate synthase